MNPREPIIAIEFKGSSFVFIRQSVMGLKYSTRIRLIALKNIIPQRKTE
jgi:hypothetical protein